MSIARVNTRDYCEFEPNDPNAQIVDFLRWILEGQESLPQMETALEERGFFYCDSDKLLERLEEDWNCTSTGPPRTKEKKNKLNLFHRTLITLLVVAVLLIAFVCLAWTWYYRERLIVKLSQPVYLVILCVGCLLSTTSAASPLLDDKPLLDNKDMGCRLQIVLYGLGFSLTCGALVTKMFSMEKTISMSLKFARQRKGTANRELVRDAASVLGLMVLGELVIIVVWDLTYSHKYTRQCEDEKNDTCSESVGRCRYQLPFMAVFFSYHMICLAAGVFMCYRVRNLPSILAEGMWVFTAIYSQIQLIIVALPILILLKDNYRVFTILKTFFICACDATVLFMIFGPKMSLVAKYVDFERDKIVHYINAKVQNSTQVDHIYQSLRISIDKTRPSSIPTFGASMSSSSPPDDTRSDSNRDSDVTSSDAAKQHAPSSSCDSTPDNPRQRGTMATIDLPPREDGPATDTSRSPPLGEPSDDKV